MSVLTAARMHTTRLRRPPMASEGPAGGGGAPLDPEVFESIWQTDESGSSTDFQIQLPTLSGGTYDFHVDWGDGESDDITVWNDAATKHTYAEIGVYTVQITGTFNGFAFNAAGPTNGGDAQKLLEATQWGILELGSTEVGHFYGCFNLAVSATDAPVVGTTLESSFRSCFRNFTGGIGHWDVSTVLNMASMIRSCTQFNEDLNDWDTSAVLDMESMFRSSAAFNGDISSWVTTAVTDMNAMFLSNSQFAQDISGWDTVAVTDMSSMFSGAFVFNQDIGGWETGEVLDMSDMFINARAFNQDISLWDTSKVTTMQNMFRGNPGQAPFNQDIGGWNVDLVVSMQSMFQGAEDFDQDISGWDMANKELMANMFQDAGLSTTNYDLLLVGWDSTADGDPGVNFDAGSSTYNSGAPAAAKVSLQGKSWTIVDGGEI